MKKLFALTAASLVAGTSAFAGAVAYVAPEMTMIEEPTQMGGSGAWLIPLLILTVLVLSLTSGEEQDG